MSYCGIDIGVENIAFSFIDEYNNVVSYKGKINKGDTYVHRYTIDEEPSEIRVVSSANAIGNVCCLLAIIPEFKQTVRTFVELQVGTHNNVIHKVEGAIHGFLLAKYPRMNIESCSSQARVKKADKYIETKGLADIKLYGRVKGTKLNTMHMVGHLYPNFYEYITQFCVKDSEWYIDKMDDICDTIAYAYLASGR